jgi:hypothetical protein
MSAPSWLDAAEDDPVDSRLVHPPPTKPSPASPAPRRGDSPSWLADDGDDGVGAIALNNEASTSPPSRKPRGGEVVTVDLGAAEPSDRAVAPATFMERMAQFEKHRARRNDATDVTPSKAPAEIRKARSTSKGTPARKQDDSYCPVPPQSGSPPTASPRRQYAGGTIGENVGLSEHSKTQVADINDFVPLSKGELEQFACEVSLYGRDTIARSRAPSFQLRAFALETIRRNFDALYTAGPMPALDGTFHALTRLVGDTVAKVAVAACGVLEYVMVQALFITDSTLQQLLPVIEVLCNAIKDGRAKVQAAAIHALHVVAEHDSVGRVIVVDALATAPEKVRETSSSPRRHEDDDDLDSADATVTQFTNTVRSQTLNATDVAGPMSEVLAAKVAALGSNWRALGSRVDVAYAMIRDTPSCVPACEQSLMTLGVAGLNCANSKVRRAAVILVTEAYKTLRTAVEPYLSAVTAQSTLKLLREEIDVEICDDAGEVAAAAMTDVQRQETIDLATFNAEDSSSKLTEEQMTRLGFWREALPQLQSLPCLFSSTWRLRKRVLDRLGEYPGLMGVNDSEASEPPKALSVNRDHAAVALSQIVALTLPQHVPAIATAANDIVSRVLSSPHWGHEHRRSFGMPLIEPLLKFGANEKIEDAEESAVRNLSALAQVDPSRMSGAVVTIATNVDTAIAKTAGKLLVPRLAVIGAFLDRFGTNDTTISVEQVMSFAVDCLRHPTSKVRRSAVDVVMAAYKAAGNVVQQRLQALDGAILAEVQERIATMAKRDRSRTAPCRRLATLVGGDVDDDATPTSLLTSPSGTEPSSSKQFDRPASHGSPARVEFARSQGTSLRQRMAMWRESQAANGSQSDSASPTAKAAPATSREPVASKPPKPPAPSSAGPVPVGPSGIVQPQPVRKGKLIFS